MRGALGGAALSLAGVGVVEALFLAGLQPHAPIGWPGLGLIAAAALFGTLGVLGALPVLVLSYALALGNPGRFPAFFADWHGTVAWLAGIAFLGSLAYVLGKKLRTAQLLERQLRAQQQALQESEARFRGLTQLSSDYYWEQDQDYRFVERVSGREENPYPREAVLGKTRWELPALNMTEEDWVRHRADLHARREFRDLIIQRPAPKGQMRYVSTSGRPVYDSRGRFRGYRGVGRDVTASIHAEKELRTAKQQLEIALARMQTLAQHDVLTGLANRALFRDRLDRALGRARRGGSAAALLFIDVDRFKATNDTLGHAAGDAMLRQIAQRLLGCVRETDTVGRIGGDEFVVLLDEISDRDDAARVAAKILQAVSAEPAAGAVRPTVSIGVALHERGMSAEAFMHLADGALYAAKAAGRNCVRTAGA